MRHRVRFTSSRLVWTSAVLGMFGLDAAASSADEGIPAPDLKVSIVYTGLSGSHGFDSPTACPGANRQGSDSMTGSLAQSGGVDDEGGMLYVGVMSRTTKIDLCEVKQTQVGDEWCTITLSGSSQMNVTLEIYGDGRGAYVKAQPAKKSPVKKSVGGDCEDELTSEVRRAYPDDDMMSGIPFETVPSRSLRRGKWKSGNFTLEVT